MCSHIDNTSKQNVLNDAYLEINKKFLLQRNGPKPQIAQSVEKIMLDMQRTSIIYIEAEALGLSKTTVNPTQS